MAMSSIYLMEIYVGTPPTKQMVNVDTGSDMSWTQCLPCVKCFAQNLPIFKPDQSSSYQVLKNNSDECVKLGNDRGYAQPNENCEYDLIYSDNSGSYGELAKETFTIGRTSIPNIVYGCGHDNTGVFDAQSTGIIGLGDGPLSFFGQIKDSIGGMFSYCLVSQFGSNPTARSRISFGNNAIVDGDGVMTSPLLKRNDSSHYFLTLESISIGNRIIQMVRQSGNIIIDTGTTLNFLPKVVLQNLKEAIMQEIYNSPIDLPDRPDDDEFCYRIDTDLPTITYHFANGANVALSKWNIFSRYENAMCLNIKEDNYLSIFGNRAQMNFLIGYNIPEENVYFKPMDCSRHIRRT